MAYKRISEGKIDTLEASMLKKECSYELPCENCNYCVGEQSVQAQVYNFMLIKGSTFTKTIKYKQSDGTPYDLTGYTAQLLCANKEKAFEIPCTIENALQGEISLNMPADDTKNIDNDNQCNSIYKYQLELKSDSGTVYRILEGKVFVSCRCS